MSVSLAYNDEQSIRPSYSRRRKQKLACETLTVVGNVIPLASRLNLIKILELFGLFLSPIMRPVIKNVTRCLEPEFIQSVVSKVLTIQRLCLILDFVTPDALLPCLRFHAGNLVNSCQSRYMIGTKTCTLMSVA